VVYHDSEGMFLACAVVLITYCYDLKIAEAMTFKWSMETVSHLSFSRVKYEIDSLERKFLD